MVPKPPPFPVQWGAKATTTAMATETYHQCIKSEFTLPQTLSRLFHLV